MKSIFTSFLLLLAATLNSAIASERYYHNLDGSHVSLQVCDSLITVKFAPSVPQQQYQNLAQAEAGLVDNYVPIDRGMGFQQFRVTTGYNVETLLSQLWFNVNVEFATPVFVWDDSLFYFAGDQIMLRPKEGVGQSWIDSVLAAFALTAIRQPDSLQISLQVAMTPESPSDVFEICHELFATGNVYYAYPNLFGRLAKPCSIPDDPYYPHWQWNLNHGVTFPGSQSAQIQMEQAWDFADGDTNIVIAIIDGAFDMSHEDLDFNRVWRPYDAAGAKASAPTPDSDPDLPETGWQFFSVYWHGTACLGLICPVTNNQLGIAGTASKLKFMPIKFMDDNLSTSAEAVENSWKWAQYRAADVVSISLGFPGDVPAITQIMQQGYEQGTAWIVSAGNTPTTISFPANLSCALAVGGISYDNQIASYSGRGPGLDVVAPTDLITTLDVMGPNGYSLQEVDHPLGLNYYEKFNGTSASAPQVAAVAGLVLSRRADLHCIDCTAEPLYEVLRHSSVDRVHPSDPSGYDTNYGYGRLSARNALLAVTRGDADNNGLFTISDAVYLITYIFGGGPAPSPHQLLGDADGNGLTTISDAVMLITYIFGGGPKPPVSFSNQNAYD